MLCFTLIAIALGLLVVWRKWSYGYWKRNKVPCPEPTFPVGNLGSILMMKEHTGVAFQNWYK